MSYSWKLRNEQNSAFGEWENHENKGFLPPEEQQLLDQNNEFNSTDLKSFIEPFLNKHSNVTVVSEHGVETIKIEAVTLCEKGMYLTSKSLRLNFSNRYKSIPSEPKDWKQIYADAEELAEYLGIEYR